MTPSLRASRPSLGVLLLLLAGCGGDEPQPGTGVVAGPDRVVPAAPDPAATVATRDDSAAEPAVADVPPQPAAVRDRATVDAAAEQARHAAGDAAGAVQQAVGDARTQAKQAADDAAAGVQGFAAELRDDAKRSVAAAADQFKASARGAADDARRTARGKLDAAKEDARRRARDAGADIRQRAEAAEGRLLDGVLGPDSRATSP